MPKGLRWVALFLAAGLLLRCGGGGSSSAAVVSFSYADSLFLLRVGEPIASSAPAISGGVISDFQIVPALPSGLSLNSSSGMISGTPSAESPLTAYTVSAKLAGKDFSTVFSIAVGPALPAVFSFLEKGFAAEIVQENVSIPVRMALAPDGRLFFNELTTGNIRILDSAGSLLSQPFANLPVLTGGHRGLLGLALDPNFSSNGFVYVSACTASSGGHPDRIRIVRFTDSGNLGTNPTVIVDDLPIGQINNGGELLFDLGGNLLITVGDVENPPNAQDDLSLAGKILRYTSLGSIPASNPSPSSPEWSRGIRNTFALAMHPQTGDLLGADNGPASDDELNFIQAGKNFEWGMSGPGSGFGIGFKVTGWVDVITPTAMSFHDGTGFGAEYKDFLFLSSYSDEAVRAIRLTGANFTDYQEEKVFARFAPNVNNNKPLDILEAPNGSLYLSTFYGIYRIWKFA